MLFLVNLESATERRAHMVRQLEALGLAFGGVGFDGRGRCADDIADDGVAHDAGHSRSPQLHGHRGRRGARQPIRRSPYTPVESPGGFDVVFLGTSSRNLSRRGHVLLGRGLQLHRPIGSVYNTWGCVITRRYCEQLFARLQPVKWPIDHVLGGKVKPLKPRRAVVQPPIVREDPGLGLQSQIEPYTFRFDRLRLVESAQRRLLGSRVGDLYSRLHHLL